MSGKQLHYGIADRAWQPVVGCDPHMPCAPRCWARRTVARVVECQRPVSPERAQFYQIALTPDGAKWSGEVLLDEAHLKDPLGWKKPALIATGFHGDWGRLDVSDMARIIAVASCCSNHRFLMLTKQPDRILAALDSGELEGIARAEQWEIISDRVDPLARRRDDIRATSLDLTEAPPNVSIGASVMNQTEADKMREPMNLISALGWNTHVWYEPALGPVDWLGWGFLGGIIAGGESGKDSRPSEAAWFRQTQRWCEIREVPFRFKQWGDYLPPGQVGAPEGHMKDHPQIAWSADKTHPIRLNKCCSGRLLDDREWNDVPRFGKVEVLHHAR